MRQLKISKQITFRESDSLEKYLLEIGKVEMITAEQEAHLAREIRKGSESALEELTRANLRFVVSVAKQYQNQGLSLSDLINEGNVGLIKAAKRFDETKGFKFISYAVWWIRQSILQSLAEQARIVRLPMNKVGSLTKVTKAFAKLEQEFEREPMPQELADLLDITAADITTLLGGNARPVSFDAPLTEGEDGSLIDVLEDDGESNPDKGLMTESLKKEIERVLSILSKRDAEIVSHYYGLRGNKPHNLEEIGDKFGLTRERVRQIKERAIRRMRKTSSSKVLKIYLG